uniref:Putative secreted peptide n=1 Tax=Anopheles braziliensis TaxID=58242 RepID=A0A2M3ZMW3_9DIPT
MVSLLPLLLSSFLANAIQLISFCRCCVFLFGLYLLVSTWPSHLSISNSCSSSFDNCCFVTFRSIYRTHYPCYCKMGQIVVKKETKAKGCTLNGSLHLR